MATVLVTGGKGFIGSHVAKFLKSQGNHIRITSRINSKGGIDNYEYFNVGNLDFNTDWRESLYGVEVVVHCAARAHILRDKDSNPLDIFREVNVGGTVSLVSQSIEAGVRMFIYISSIGVNGFETLGGDCFSESSPARPHDAYSLSKFEAENSLIDLARNTNMNFVIIRPPLVYGFGAPGNFDLLVRLIKTGLPLPFGGINNKRSFVSVENLVHFIFVCINHPNAINQIFLVSDDNDLSTPELIRTLSSDLQLTCHLFSVPIWLLKVIGWITFRPSSVRKICTNLQLNISKSRNLLGWKPSKYRSVCFSDKKNLNF